MKPLALVTGAGSGIGRAAAVALAPDYDIGLVGRSIDSLSATADAVAAAGGVATPLPVDVGDEAALSAAITSFVAEGRQLRAIVASAGVQLMDADSPVVDLDTDVWNTTLRTNLTGMFLTFKHGVPHLQAAGGGAVVAVGSPNGLRGGLESWSSAYNSSKSGTHALARSLAIQLAPDGIRVNVVVPGFIVTPMNDAILDDPVALAEASALVPLGRPGTADEVGDAIAFLCSDRASYITGSYLMVDGGLTT